MTERTRASLFGGSEPLEPTPVGSLDLSRFKPAKAPEFKPELAHKIAEEQGFTARHATKAKGKPDGRRLKRSDRSVQFNVRLRPDVSARFWSGAEAAGAVYADDFLDQLLTLYEETVGRQKKT